MQQQLGPAIFVTNGVDVGLIAPASSFQKMKEQRYVRKGSLVCHPGPGRRNCQGGRPRQHRCHGPGCRGFRSAPPLAYRAEQARDIEGINAWFETWRNGVTVHMADPQLMIDGDLAVAFGLSRMTGIKTDGTKADSWSRRTIVLRRIAGSWKIIHEHASFPMAMDGSGRAVTDLLP
ncbi:YybH family protein [Mesorhizobium muleiense]|uniref:YybH family protein n=1 Tax=Mesorhizobium muleiense TaxID=1004279 RepID=UPI003AFAE308